MVAKRRQPNPRAPQAQLPHPRVPRSRLPVSPALKLSNRYPFLDFPPRNRFDTRESFEPLLHALQRMATTQAAGRRGSAANTDIDASDSNHHHHHHRQQQHTAQASSRGLALMQHSPTRPCGPFCRKCTPPKPAPTISAGSSCSRVTTNRASSSSSSSSAVVAVVAVVLVNSLYCWCRC